MNKIETKLLYWGNISKKVPIETEIIHFSNCLNEKVIRDIVWNEEENTGYQTVRIGNLIYSAKTEEWRYNPL